MGQDLSKGIRVDDLFNLIISELNANHSSIVSIVSYLVIEYATSITCIAHMHMHAKRYICMLSI